MNIQEEITTKCPECKCEAYTYEDELGDGFRICKKCGQEWWTKVDYTKPLDTITKVKIIIANRAGKLPEHLENQAVKLANLIAIKETEVKIDTLKICDGHQQTGTILNSKYFIDNITKLEQQLLKLKDGK